MLYGKGAFSVVTGKLRVPVPREGSVEVSFKGRAHKQRTLFDRSAPDCTTSRRISLPEKNECDRPVASERVDK